MTNECADERPQQRRHRLTDHRVCAPIGATPAMSTDDSFAWLTVDEVADQLRVSVMTIYRLTERGRMASTRVGRSIRIHRNDLNEYLQAQRRPRRLPTARTTPPQGAA